MGYWSTLKNRINNEYTDENKAKAQNLFNELLSRGYQTDVAQEAAANLAKTGNIEIPQYQTNKLPVSDKFSQLWPNGLPVRAPATRSFGEQVYTSPETGSVVNRIPKTNEKDTFSQTKSLDGENVYVDAKTGNEIRRESNGTATSKIVKVGTTGGGKDSPDLVLKKKAITEIMKLQANDKEVPQTLTDLALSGEGDVGVNITQPDVTTTEEPGFIGKMFGKKPVTTTTKGPPQVKFGGNTSSAPQSPQGPPTTNDPQMKKDIEEAIQAVAHKLVSEKDAHARLVKKYGKRIPPL